MGRRPEARFQGLPAEYLRDAPVRSTCYRQSLMSWQGCNILMQCPSVRVYTMLPRCNTHCWPRRDQVLVVVCDDAAAGDPRGVGGSSLECGRVWERQQGRHPRHLAPHQRPAQPQWCRGGPHMPCWSRCVGPCGHGQGHPGRCGWVEALYVRAGIHGVCSMNQHLMPCHGCSLGPL